MMINRRKDKKVLPKGHASLPVYTMEEVEKQSADKTKVLIVINDGVYDVTNFLERHPGGDLVLQNMAGRDCTEVFENYHQANPHISRNMLRSFLIGIAKDRPTFPHVEHFRAIREELVKQGMFEVDASYYVKLCMWLLFLFVSSLYLSIGTEKDSLVCHMLGAMVLGLFWQQIGGLGHDLGHSNVLRHINSDHLVSSVLGCCIMGISTAWWKRSHNTHHVVCNSVENDPDVQHMPMMAVSEKVIQSPYWSTYHCRWFQLDQIAEFFVGYQHILFLPIMALARFNMYLQSWLILLNQNVKVKFRKLEVCSLIFFACWYIEVALSMKTWYESVAWILVSHATAGILHVQIVVSHWAMETYHDEDYSNDENDEWYRLQLKTTMDIDCPPWMDWAHLGLQFQIEHHLFPALPRHNLRYASKLVQKVCKEQGIPYHHDSFSGAIHKNVKALSETAAKARSGKYASNILIDILNCNG